jgi:hypothetical protein
MRHFVHGPDGSKYGPADLPTLQLWKNENRITPNTLLEPEVGGTTFAAKDLPGLFPELQQRQTYGQADWNYAPYPVPQQGADQGSKNLAPATWVLGALALLVCPLLCGLAAIGCAVSASQKGHPQGRLLIAYAVGCTVLGFVLSALAWAVMNQLSSSLK